MALRQAPISFELNMYDLVRTKTNTVISHSEAVFFHWSAAMEGRRTQDAKKATVGRLRSSFGPVIGSGRGRSTPTNAGPYLGASAAPSDPIKRSKASPASENRTIRPEPNRRCLSSGFPGLSHLGPSHPVRANCPFVLSSRSKACFACLSPCPNCPALFRQRVGAAVALSLSIEGKDDLD
jgi:hypothetical protein